MSELLSPIQRDKSVLSHHTFQRELVSKRFRLELIISGNTDCKMYYNLSKHVYRFMGGPSGGGGGVVSSSYRLKGKSD